MLCKKFRVLSLNNLLSCAQFKKKKKKEEKNFFSFANLLPYEPKTSGDIVQKQIQPS